MIGYRYATAETESLEFSGPNIYRAIYAYEIMNERGFEVNLVFEGKWTDTGENAQGTGTVLKGEEGTFTIKYREQEITVGGPTSGKEHIAAGSIKLEPAHSAVVKLGLTARSSDSLDMLVKELDTLAETLVSDIHNTGISGSIMLDSETLLKPTILQEIDNILGPGNEVEFYETGLVFSINNADTKDLAEIANMLRLNNIEIAKAATSRMTVLVRADEQIDKTEDELSANVPETANVYSLKIIKKSVQ